MKKDSFLYLIGSGIIFVTTFINRRSYTLGSLWLVISAFVLYFLIVNRKKKNYFSINALYTGVWLLTIGLSNLKLLSYQRVWATKTWIILSMGYLLLNLFIEIGGKINNKYIEQLVDRFDISFFNENLVFFICVISGIVAVLGFVATYRVVGFLPFTSDIYNAYSLFYSKYLLLSHFTIINIPISYLLSKKINSNIKKFVLYILIFIQVFIIPILAVNRGVYLIGALLLTCVIYYSGKKTFWGLALCILLTFSGYEIGSIGRNYTRDMLSISFQQSGNELEENIVQENDVEEDVETDVNEYGEYVEHYADNIYVVQNTNNKLSDINVHIDERILFLYSYLTVSHDNFDLVVKYSDSNDGGLRQLMMFDILLKRIWPDYTKSFKEYYVQYNLNTSNFLSTSYQDMGLFGTLFFVAILGLLIGYLEKTYLKNKKNIYLLLLSVFGYCVILSFFSNYTRQSIFVFNLVAIVFYGITINVFDKLFFKKGR